MRMTPKRAEIVSALRNEAVYMLVRSASNVPVHRRKAMLTGTKVIKLVGEQEQVVAEHSSISGVAAAGLIEAGYLVELEDKKLPFGGRLFVLSDSGKALDLPAVSKPSGWDAETGAKVFRRDLNAMAAKHGASVELNTTRHWWELVFQNPKIRVTLTNDKEQPIARLNDLSVSQWQDAIDRAFMLKPIV